MTVYIYVRDYITHLARPGGGLYKAVGGLAGGIVAAGHDCVVLCEGTLNLAERSPAGYLVQCFKREPNARTFDIAPGLVTFIEALPKPSLFALNGIFVPGCYAVSKLLRRLGQPYVVAPHDPFHPAIFEKSKLKKWVYWRLYERKMLRGAAAIQVLDKRHEKYVRDNGIHVPTIEVVNGYAAGDVPTPESIEYRDAGTMKFLFLGRVDAHNKGLDLLVDAFADVCGPLDAELTVMGPDWGDQSALREQAAARGMGAKVKIVGPDFETTSGEIMRKCDALVMPSRFEGFGLSALEAMLAGRVVMVSEVAGLTPHVRAADCGVVVTPTIESVRAGLQTLVDRRGDWHAMGERARAYALDHFRWDRIGADAVRQYEALLS